MSDRLRTFCHISEYDEAGYRQLHRLIAASDPLVLWAPSSHFLSDPGSCPVSSQEFLDFIEKGKIQVVGREDWLNSQPFREKHKWAGASWNGFIDDALQEMFRRDQGVADPRQRRVAAAPEEDGKEMAQRAIDENPEVATEIVGALKDDGASGEIPPGTLQTAVRSADDAIGRAKIVLRDAYNHADAIRRTQADTAILLGPREGIFSRRVAASYVEVSEDEGGQGGEPLSDRSSTITAAEVSSQLIDLLAILESLGPPAELLSFMEGPGHRELISWSRHMIELLGGSPSRELTRKLVLELRSRLDEGEFQSPSADDLFFDASSLILSIVGCLEGAETVTLLGLAFATYPLLKAEAQRRDFVPTKFSGPQWPFRYLWGGGAKRGRRTDLIDLLSGGGPLIDPPVSAGG